MSSQRLAAAALGLAAAFLPQLALAHSPFPGAEGFYLGILHPLSTPGQLLALLAIGVMLGWRWRDAFARSWAGFAVAALVGIALGQLEIRPDGEEVYLLLVAVIAATLSALHPKGHGLAHVTLASAGGLLIGLLSTPDPGPRAATIITLAGSFVGANLTLFYVSGAIGLLHERFTQHWVEVGLRVAAAWIAAVAVLMGALAFAGTG